MDLARRLSSIPAMMDREDMLNRDVAHHERRLALLQKIAEIEKTAADTTCRCAPMGWGSW